MKKFNHLFTLLLTVVISSFLFSCNTAEKETAKEEPVLTQDTVPAMKADPQPVFKPFDIVEISHSVKDYEKWRTLFDGDSAARISSGLEKIVIGRGIDNANNLMVVLNVSDVQKAKDFSNDPRLKEVMSKGGVISKPSTAFFHVIRFNSEANEKQWVVITHKVKDFNAWLKVFDEEGSVSRANQGLIDVAIAQGTDDPNLVHVVFDIKDLAKAKAAIASEEKKKLMMTAGVEGEPKIEFYNSAD